MRIDAHQVFNVSVRISEYFNVDLSNRGFYQAFRCLQIRIKPKKAPGMTSVVISHETETEFVDLGTQKCILQSHVEHNTAVSKTVEVTWQDEHFILDDWFQIAVAFDPSLNLSEQKILELEVQLCVADRYVPPKFENFEIGTSRTIEIPLDPTRLVTSARNLQFDSSFLSSVSIAIFSSLVMIGTQRRRMGADAVFKAMTAKNPKLQRIYNSSANALLFATRSIEQFIVRNSSLLGGIPINILIPEILDVSSTMKEALLRFGSSDSALECLERDINGWSSKVTLAYQQMLLLFKNSDPLMRELLRSYDRQRSEILREAFWVNERSIDEIAMRCPVSVAEFVQTYRSLNRVDYLKKLPRVPIFCNETDSTKEFCPVILEDRFSKHPDQSIKNVEQKSPDSSSLPGTSPMPAFKKSGKHKSFRDRLRHETRKLIDPRRKSLDCSQSLSRKVLQKKHSSSHRLRSDTDGGTLVALDQLTISYSDNTDANIPGCSSRTLSSDIPFADASSQGTASSFKSLPTDSPSHSSDLQRCSAAGELEVESAGPLLTKESVTSTDVVNALRSSVSADNVLDVKDEQIRRESVSEASSRTKMDMLDLVRQRELAKRILREEAKFDGVLYSELIGRNIETPYFLPAASKFIDGEATRRGNFMNTHLVVFIHGLEGTKEDLGVFRAGLDQAIHSHYHTFPPEQKDERWNFEYLMSRVNERETWEDIKSLATNLLEEIKDALARILCIVSRISFVAHSLGGVIARCAIGMAHEQGMKDISERCHTLLTINSPHLGLAYIPKHIHWGVQIIKWLKKSLSMDQMTFRDAPEFSSCFFYKLANNGAMGKFRHVLLVGSPNDQIVPYNSAVLVPSKNSSEDQSRFGQAYREMMSAMLSSVKSSERTETFIRYTSFHTVTSQSPAKKLSGRADHVVALEDDVFVEKLFRISALKYFI